MKGHEWPLTQIRSVDVNSQSETRVMCTRDNCDRLTERCSSRSVEDGQGWNLVRAVELMISGAENFRVRRPEEVEMCLYFIFEMIQICLRHFSSLRNQQEY